MSDAIQVGCDGYLVTLRDITEQKNHELEREAVLAISDALRGTPSRIQILTTILNKLENLMHIDKAIVINRDGQLLQVFHRIGARHRRRVYRL